MNVQISAHLFRLILCAALLATPALAEPPPRPVRVLPVSLIPRSETLILSGTIQARHNVDVGFRVAGKVIERPVDIGQTLAPGQVIARIDPTDIKLNLAASEAALRSAEADAANARIDLARYDGLKNSAAFVPTEYDRRFAVARMAEARLVQAQRQRDLASQQLHYTDLHADEASVVTALPVDVGQVVAVAQTVATLAETAETEMVTDVPESRLDVVRGAREVAVSLWAAPDRPIAGRVREIAGRADAAARTYTVKISLIDPPPGLVALGMTASVRFTAGAPGTIARLPASALTGDPAKPAVWVLDTTAGRAALRPVTIGRLAGDGSVIVLDGLQNGDLVVTAGASTIDANQPLVAWAGTIR